MAEEQNNVQDTPTSEAKFTQEDVDRILQERLTDEKSRRERAIEKAVAEALHKRDEEQRIQTLQGEDRLKAEAQARIDAIQAEQAKTAELLASTQRELAISKAEAQLAGLGLPTQFAPNLLGADDKETSKNIAEFSGTINELVTAKVNESLARGAPRAGGASPSPQDALYEQLRKVAHLPAKGGVQ
jgi:hypothetical protein